MADVGLPDGADGGDDHFGGRGVLPGGDDDDQLQDDDGGALGEALERVEDEEEREVRVVVRGRPERVDVPQDGGEREKDRVEEDDPLPRLQERHPVRVPAADHRPVQDLQ